MVTMLRLVHALQAPAFTASVAARAPATSLVARPRKLGTIPTFLYFPVKFQGKSFVS